MDRPLDKTTARSIIGIAIFFIFLISASVVFFIYYSSGKNPSSSPSTGTGNSTNIDNSAQPLSEAEIAGTYLSNGNCSGTGPVEITVSPMREEDFAFLIPYGLMIGAHVTPIDHQYFSPTDFYSPRDTYKIFAAADGKIVDISHRVSMPGSEHVTDEYRLVFMHTCTFLTYYDLVTSLAPKIETEFNKHESNNDAGLSIPVKAGDLIGFIGGQTLDFAVWDIEKPLSGFVVPEHYESEAWKIYTADPYDYYSEELSEMLTRKNLRTAEPIAGKIDYDIDGKLIGNWFKEGTNGYAGKENLNYEGDLAPYYVGHLAIVPNHLDPTGYMISIGDYNGEPAQFMAGGGFDPTLISPETGPVTVNLMDFEYKTPDGQYWKHDSLVRGLKIEEAQQNHGCILFEMLEERKLKVVLMTSGPCELVDMPISTGEIYER